MILSRNKLYLLLVISCLAGYIWLGFSVLSEKAGPDSESVCIFKQVTGIPCPSCGSTRSVISLFKGNISDAVFWNPFGIIIFVIIIITIPWIIYDLYYDKETLYRNYLKGEEFLKRKTVAIPAIILVLINWLWNIHKGL